MIDIKDKLLLRSQSKYLHRQWSGSLCLVIYKMWNWSQLIDLTTCGNTPRGWLGIVIFFFKHNWFIVLRCQTLWIWIGSSSFLILISIKNKTKWLKIVGFLRKLLLYDLLACMTNPIDSWIRGFLVWLGWATSLAFYEGQALSLIPFDVVISKWLRLNST